MIAPDYAAFLALVAEGLSAGSLPAEDSEHYWVDLGADLAVSE